MSPLPPLICFLAAAVSLPAAPTATPAPATATTTIKAPTATPTSPVPVAQIVEKAPENFPLTLRGFFGKGDKAEISVQDNASGKSVWLKPGDSNSGWKLESADTAKGRAVFSQGGRRVVLLQAGERHEPVETTPEMTEETIEAQSPKLTSIDDSIVRKKITDPKFKKLVLGIRDKSADILLKSHPEFFKENGELNDRAPGAIIALTAEMKRLMETNSSPEAAEIRPAITALFDAAERTKPFTQDYRREHDRLSQEVDASSGGITEDDRAKHRALAQKQFEHGSGNSELLRTFEEADRIYMERNGGK